ncbi:hypothetical protein BY457_105131 [Marinilabilia salmonicolor]|jgi:hypothetical protein|nr:hypothetical protein BY457_105131 [Marinilabilia salmonicolor]
MSILAASVTTQVVLYGQKLIKPKNRTSTTLTKIKRLLIREKNKKTGKSLFRAFSGFFLLMSIKTYFSTTTAAGSTHWNVNDSVKYN